MSLLLDENLSPRLVARLAALFPGIMHVREVGLRQADDSRNWSWASENGHIVVTADADFLTMTARLSRGPKIIHIPRCDIRFRVMEDLPRQNAIRFAAFEKDMEERLLVLQV